MGDVIYLNKEDKIENTNGNLAVVDDILEGRKGEFKHIVIVGIEEATGDIVLVTDYERKEDINYLIDKAKQMILKNSLC